MGCRMQWVKAIFISKTEEGVFMLVALLQVTLKDETLRKMLNFMAIGHLSRILRNLTKIQIQ